MGQIKGFAREGSPRDFTFSHAAENSCKLGRSSGGVGIRTALLGCLLAFCVGVGSLLAGEKGDVTGIIAGLSKTPIPGAKVTLAAGRYHYVCNVTYIILHTKRRARLA